MKVDLHGVFSGRRVLVTGHTGFKGSWLSLWLSELGAEVTGFALAPEYSSSHFEVLELDRRVKHVEGDLRDAGSFQAAFDKAQPEVVFHLAAQALVRRSYDDPKATIDTNVTGSVNVLEAVRASNDVKSLVFVTSDKCYLNKEWVWGYRENDELGGHDPYSASKAAAEARAEATAAMLHGAARTARCTSAAARARTRFSTPSCRPGHRRATR